MTFFIAARLFSKKRYPIILNKINTDARYSDKNLKRDVLS